MSESKLYSAIYDAVAQMYVWKGAVASHETPKADEDTEWTASEAVMRLRKWASSDDSGDKDALDWKKYRKGFAWFDESDEESFGSYKLPHHDIMDDELKVVWKGVVAAGNAVQGGRGGVDLPDEDMDGVKAHLARHYKQFGKDAPWEEEDEKAMNGIVTKEGREMSDKNRKMISKCIAQMNEAISALQALLDATDPDNDS